jgi:hypothetical protein
MRGVGRRDKGERMRDKGRGTRHEAQEMRDESVSSILFLINLNVQKLYL